MDGLVEKIVEKYSDDLLRWFPLQKIFVLIVAALIFHLGKNGEYLSALNSFFHISIHDLAGDDGVLLKINMGALFFAFVLVVIGNVLQEIAAQKFSHLILAGYDFSILSKNLHLASTQIELPPEIINVLANENIEKLKIKKARLMKISSIAEFIFIISIIEIIIVFYGGNILDFFISISLLLAWLIIRSYLIFKFISEILPVEAHIAGIRGVEYELTTDSLTPASP